jgi:predicted CXXCH cytochrome family protein
MFKYLFILFILSFTVESVRAESPTPIGTETCLGCHDGATPRSVHAASDCEACHGPGSDHAENDGDPKRIVQPTAHPERMAELCLTCHGRDPHVAAFRFGAHARAKVRCFTCHKVHTPEFHRSHSEVASGRKKQTPPYDFPEWDGPIEPSALLKLPEPRICYTCHPSVRTDFVKPFVHPVPDPIATEAGDRERSLVRCGSCHDPHSSRPAGRSVAGRSEATCGACHLDKSPPFAFEHEAGREEGCAACHRPHGSSRPNLLKTGAEFVCRSCHNSMSPGHGSRQGGNCLACHPEFHGSHLSPRFLE